ncbi:MAG: hypothetical protein Kow0029_24320 [Candidatus Rifleibacteriota bacterium]
MVPDKLYIAGPKFNAASEFELEEEINPPTGEMFVPSLQPESIKMNVARANKSRAIKLKLFLEYIEIPPKNICLYID